MADKHAKQAGKWAARRGHTSNVKHRPKYERFGETIRYLTLEELQQFLDTITDYRHKLMLRLIYELGCRVGEFVRIQLKHLDFGRGRILFPAENTKTGHGRTSHVPRGLLNEIISILRRDGRISKRQARALRPESFLFHPPGRPNVSYTENRLRQIFVRYRHAAGLELEYGVDAKGRGLQRLTIHSLRHSHIMHYIHAYRLPLPIVQKQVGHKTLKATSVYLRPSDEAVADAYEEAQTKTRRDSPRREATRVTY